MFNDKSTQDLTGGGLQDMNSVRRRRISRNRTMIDALITDGTNTLHARWFNPYVKIEEGWEPSPKDEVGGMVLGGAYGAIIIMVVSSPASVFVAIKL